MSTNASERNARPCEWRSRLTNRSRAEFWCSNIHSLITERVEVLGRDLLTVKREWIRNVKIFGLRKPSKSSRKRSPTSFFLFFSSIKHPRTLFFIKKFVSFFNYSKSINNYDSNLSLLLLVFFSLGGLCMYDTTTTKREDDPLKNLFFFFFIHSLIIFLLSYFDLILVFCSEPALSYSWHCCPPLSAVGVTWKELTCLIEVFHLLFSFRLWQENIEWRFVRF